MRRLSLGTLLALVMAALGVAAIAGVYLAGAGVLARLADDQATARVFAGGVAAAAAIDGAAADLQRSARLLTERPTLRRLLESGETDEASAFLDEFRATSGHSGVAIAQDGRVLVTSRRLDGWPALLAAAHGDEGTATVTGADGGPMLIAWSSWSEAPARTVVVARLLDADFAAALGDELGLAVSFTARTTLERDGADPSAALGLAALDAGRPIVRAFLRPARRVVAVPLPFAGAGEAQGVVLATLDAAVLEEPQRRLAARLGMLALAAAAVLVGLAPWVARRLTRPIEELRTAAARLGGGDLASPIPRVGTVEIATLAATMEEMRERVLRLTRELEKRRLESEAILNGISEGVFAVDRERAIRYVNPQAALLLGIDAADAIGRFCGDVLRPEPRDGGRPCEEHCPILHARFRGETRATEHLRGARALARTVVVTSAPPSESSSADEPAPLQFQVLRDETDVEAGRRLRDSVLANISHEFRTPLSAQLASLELLRDKLPDLSRDETRGLVLALERGALRLARLVDNLLESTRIEAGEVSIRQQDVALDAVVEEAVGLTAPLVEQRGQTLDVDVAYPLPRIVGDAPRLVQVVVNLLANANKFAPGGSRIRVRVEAVRDAVTITVEDEGPGLPEGTEEAVFHRFARGGGGEPEQSGMGLGLFIVKSIVERHGGAVAAQSGPRGTRMLVTIPAAREA